MSNKIKTYHSKLWGGHIGMVKDEKEYEAVKYGKKDWKPHIKEQLKAVQIPAEVFFRLMRMDRTITTIPFEGKVTLEEGVQGC